MQDELTMNPGDDPRILLVEDDATSAAFLAAAAEALPAVVDIAGSLAAARMAVERNQHDVWLIDANLPDGSGIELLDSLRARGLRVPAIAHTAAHDRATHDALIDAGFEQVLVKPLGAAHLHAAIRRVLGGRVEDAVAATVSYGALPVWDDVVAAAALKGSLGNVQALRKLCLGELPRARDEVVAAIRDRDIEALNRVLHKLRASCGFVGAARLDAAVRALHVAPLSGVALDNFNDALQETLSSPD
jgi:CheY-like chemotaxis protein